MAEAVTPRPVGVGHWKSAKQHRPRTREIT
jgi:hypothetical protein